MVKPAVPKNKDGNCADPYFISNGEISTTFTVYRTKNLDVCTEIGDDKTLPNDCKCGDNNCQKGSKCVKQGEINVCKTKEDVVSEEGKLRLALGELKVFDGSTQLATSTVDGYSAFEIDASKKYEFRYSQPSDFKKEGASFMVSMLDKEGYNKGVESFVANEFIDYNFNVNTKYAGFEADFSKFNGLTAGKVHLVRISFNPTPNKVITLDPKYIYIKAAEQKCGPANNGVCIQELSCDLTKNNKLEGCISGQVCCNPK